MNRLEKLKDKLCDNHLNCFDLAPPTAGLSFIQGWNAASAEYEKIIAELEGALKWYEKRDRIHGIKRASPAIDSLKKLKEFRGGE